MGSITLTHSMYHFISLKKREGEGKRVSLSKREIFEEILLMEPEIIVIMEWTRCSSLTAKNGFKTFCLFSFHREFQ